ncbi:MAG: hypothetical protein HN732_25065 [Rhodospirillaceae bacterium]|jgi:hypothetical protein|nr:hypothetical protein [Rhodospirillaceae bacterium]
MNETEPQEGLALNMIEVGLALSGITAVLTPLALWTAWSELVFYWMLSVGCIAFLAFMALARLRGYLTGDDAPGTTAIDNKSLRQRRVEWEQVPQINREIRNRLRSTKGDARRELSYMFRITSMLILFAVILFLAVWGLMEYRYN